MTTCAGRVCGVWDAGCGVPLRCGTCSDGLCSSQGTCELPDAGNLDGGPDGGLDAGLTCPSTRSLTDRPDDSQLLQVRALYVLPSDLADEALDTSGRICTSMRVLSSKLEALAGRRLRLDTQNGVLDIGFARLGRTDAELHGTVPDFDVERGHAYVRERIERSLADAGVLKPGKLYAVYYGGTSRWACGGASYPPTLPGQVVAMYLKARLAGAVACEASPWGTSLTQAHYFDWAMLHDLLHGLGVVPSSGRNHHSFGHVFDSSSADAQRDLMYQPRSAQDPFWATDDARGLLLDVGRDDYFAHDGGWLDLARSAFLEPLPPGARPPPGW